MNAMCCICEEPIHDKERVLPLRCDVPDARETNEMVHLECLMRSVVGSVGHQQQMCSCYGRVDYSEDGLTRRECAVAAFRHYELNGGRV